MDTILISGGRKDKIRPGDILGALTGEAGGLNASDVGKIEIQDRLTYVAVTHSVSREAVASLNRGRIKGKRFRATLVGGGARSVPGATPRLLAGVAPLPGSREGAVRSFRPQDPP